MDALFSPSAALVILFALWIIGATAFITIAATRRIPDDDRSDD